jgi:hypothetical protein
MPSKMQHVAKSLQQMLGDHRVTGATPMRTKFGHTHLLTLGDGHTVFANAFLNRHLKQYSVPFNIHVGAKTSFKVAGRTVPYHPISVY